MKSVRLFAYFHTYRAQLNFQYATASSFVAIYQYIDPSGPKSDLGSLSKYYMPAIDMSLS